MTHTRISGALVLSLSALLAGCEGCQDHSHPHDGADAHPEHDDDEHVEGEGQGHEHAEGAIGITKWTDKLELFAEHPPAISGQELPFLAHLTLLEGFKPLETANVTLVLEGPQTVKATASKKLRSGIFQPTLTAPQPGNYKARLEISGPEIEDTITGFKIEVYPSTEAAKKSHEEESDDTGTITLLKEQQWKLPFRTAFSEKASVSPAIEVSGLVSTPPSGQADVGAAISGRLVPPTGGLPRPGQAVKRGELLATIAPAPAAPEDGARAELAIVEAKAREQAAQAAVDRAERLIEDEAISQREVDDARRELGVAEEAVKAAKRAQAVFAGSASGNGAGSYRVTAPIDGVVVEVSATTGKSVKGGDPLFRVVNLNELWLVAHVPEQQAALIRSDQDASFQLPGLEQWLPLDVTGDDAIASVINVGRTVERRSRTVEVIYGLHEPDERLRVGALLHVAVPAGDEWKGIVVPRGAVLEDEGNSVVYVQVTGESFEERSVQLGPSAGASIGIESGVKAGERVVTLGANVVRLSARAGATPAHGHVH